MSTPPSTAGSATAATAGSSIGCRDLIAGSRHPTMQVPAMMRSLTLRQSLAAVLFVLAPVGAAAVEPPGPDLDLTFVVTSDPHYRRDPGRVEQNRLTIEELNRVTERSWPEKLGGGPIAVPRGVLAPGDLVDDGDKKDETPGQWAHYVSHFGFDGTDGLLKYPVFDCWGNHDGPPVGKEKHGFSTQAKLVERNRARLAKGIISRLSDNGLHYSWDWDGVHFQMLGIYPADTQHEKVKYNRVWHDPQAALGFCVEDLREQVGDSGRPVVIVAHSGFDTDWWHPEDWAAFYEAVEGYNVILYMFGHTGTGVWGWSPSPEAPKLQCINTGQTTKGFFVVRITADRLRAVYRCKDGRVTTGGGWTWKYPLDVPIERLAPDGLAGRAAAGVSR
jgi:hypothetical protein